MDARRFDVLTRTLSSPDTRRRLLGALPGLPLLCGWSVRREHGEGWRLLWHRAAVCGWRLHDRGDRVAGSLRGSVQI
jgi:hypothetical protein